MSINKKIIAACFLATSVAFTACENDVLEEITTLNTSRAFSPSGLNATVVNKTGVRLTWKAVNGAKVYNVEIFENSDFSGSPAKIVEGVTMDKVPYTVVGLSGETEYFVRVKALGSDGVEDSKWVTGTFATDAEQILTDIDLTKLTANTVTLNWPAGELATSIVLTPGNVTHTITPSEVAAGEATVSGLSGETLYTAKLMNGAKIRGTKTFTTLIDLGGAIQVNPGDDLVTLIGSATGGETFALMPGTYNVNADVITSKSISIKGAKPTDKPIIKGMVLRVRGNTGLSLKDLVLDGTGALNNNQAIIYDEASDNAFGNLNIEDCQITKYIKGLLYLNLKTLIESVNFKGNLISNIESSGGDFIDFRNGIAKTLLFENNTVYNSANARDLFRMDAGGSVNFPTITSVITIRNNTFVDVAKTSSNRFLYIRLASHQIHFTKNLIANTSGYYSNQALTTITTMENNNYFNAPNFISSTTTNAKNDVSATKLTLDPGFTDPVNGNFTISNSSLKEKEIGDPRWRK